jgi:Protein of unknown function (DUF2380)
VRRNREQHLLYITGPRITSFMGGIGRVALFSLACLGIVLLPSLAAQAAQEPAQAQPAGKAAPIKIAIFDFELEDVSPAASQPGAGGDTAAIMQKVTSEARRLMVQSGRYSLVDVSKSDAKPVIEKTLRDCDGCEAGIGLQLGADQAMIGVVRRATMTDYYVFIEISDCHTGKVINQQAVNFAGGADGWASGVGMVLRHTVLASDIPGGDK